MKKAFAAINIASKEQLFRSLGFRGILKKANVYKRLKKIIYHNIIEKYMVVLQNNENRSRMPYNPDSQVLRI